jgi:hypothetical protein
MKYKPLYKFMGMNKFWQLMEAGNLQNWAFIMRVIEKIESMGYVVKIDNTGCEIKDMNYPIHRYHVSLFAHTKLNSVYEACLRFVEKIQPGY